jgi:toxin ParE1/3/4
MTEPMITDEAQADLDEAWDFLAKTNPKAADRLIDRFVKAARVHAEYPEAGRSREDLAPGLRSFVVAPYVVFFRPSAGTIEIRRFLQGRRDSGRIMREEQTLRTRLESPTVSFKAAALRLNRTG